MVKTARVVRKHHPTRPGFPTLVKRYQEDFEKRLQAATADRMEHLRVLQCTLHPYHVAHLQEFFGRRALASIDTEAATAYAIRRRRAGESDDVVDDELRVLARLLDFAVELGWLQRRPSIWFVPRPRPVLQSGAAPRRPLFRGQPVTPAPSNAPAAAKGKKQRREYLTKPHGPDGVVPMETLKQLRADFKKETPEKLTERLNGVFPGLAATRFAVRRALDDIESLE
jgi:hypothetical protein